MDRMHNEAMAILDELAAIRFPDPEDFLRPLPARHGRVGALLQRVLFRLLRPFSVQEHRWRVAAHESHGRQVAALQQLRGEIMEALGRLDALRDEVTRLGRAQERLGKQCEVVARRVQWLGDRTLVGAEGEVRQSETSF